MEEIKGILTTQKMFNVTFNEDESVIKKELGVVVSIDNENEFKDVLNYILCIIMKMEVLMSRKDSDVWVAH